MAGRGGRVNVYPYAVMVLELLGYGVHNPYHVIGCSMREKELF